LFFASSLVAIVVAVIVYQLSLNMILAPLTAWAADTVPDEQKGMLGGWLAAGAPIGAFAGVAATSPGLDREWMQFAIICALIVTLIMPVLLLNRSAVPRPIDPGRRDPVQLRLDFGMLWLARLIVQVAGAVLFSFLLFYFKSIPQPVSQSTVAIISATTLTLAFPTTILIGRLSDRWGPRKPFLIAAVAAAAIGLLTMAVQETTPGAILGYAIFEWSIAIFLALHSAYAMQVLPSQSRRGRDMGLLNLTNTFPSLIAPVLAVWLVPGHGFPSLFALLAALMIVATICLALIRTDRQLALANRPV
jgi:MFS family permease